MNGKSNFISLLILLIWLGACTKETGIPPSQKPTYSLHGSGAPMLTNGLVLTGVARLVVRPIVSGRWQCIDVMVDDELIGDFIFQAGSNSVAVFEIDASKLRPGEHKITLGGEVDSPQGVSKWLRSDFSQTKPLEEKSWTIKIANTGSRTNENP